MELVSNLQIGFEGYISSVDDSTYVGLFSSEKTKAEKIYNFLTENKINFEQRVQRKNGVFSTHYRCIFGKELVQNVKMAQCNLIPVTFSRDNNVTSNCLELSNLKPIDVSGWGSRFSV